MTRFTVSKNIPILTAAILMSSLSFPSLAESLSNEETMKAAVDEQAQRLMDEFKIPGMAFGITIDGRRYFFNYGTADLHTNQAVTENTIFELGSVSKTFTGTIGALAQQDQTLLFSDTASEYLPELTGSKIGETPLIQLATYTAGGLPLQFPNSVTTDTEMMAFYRAWQPTFQPNTQRQYANTSIGLFGLIAAISLNTDYSTLLAEKVFTPLQLESTFTTVPSSKMADYAFGYNGKGEPVRVTPGQLDTQAYGIKSSSEDMVTFIEANMGRQPVDDALEKALVATRTAYYRASTFAQGLGWEMYPYPTALDTLLEGNSNDTILNSKPIQLSTNPSIVSDSSWVNKTGSTAGFGAYVAFIPEEKAGIVILANKNYPNAERITAAYKILNCINHDEI